MSRAETREKKKGKDIVFYIIMFILLCVMAFSGYKVYTIASEYKKGTDIYNDIAGEVGALPESTTLEQMHLDMRLTLDWQKLKEKNSDVCAWIRCAGTVINYPIVQGSDNDYYLRRLLDGTWNVKGTIFVDARCKEPFDGFLTIIYGHHMRDINKSMFTLLGDYLENRDTPFFKDHPVMELYTPDKSYDLQIFGGAVVDSMDEFVYNNYLYDEDEQQRYIERIFANNQIVGYDNSVSVSTKDHIVMMSTCMLRSEDDDKRIVIWGKLVESDRDVSGN